MKLTFAVLAAAVLASRVFAADTNSAPATADAEVKYTKAIEGRTVDILKVLALTDTNKAAQVHDTIIAQYRALRAWHDENDAKLNASKSDTNATAQIKASLKTLHDQYLATLGQNLTPDQVEQVKDKMTYGKVQFTFQGYVNQYPNLTDDHKAAILKMLKDAREEAMDGGSSDEKTAVFQRYKGRINNYLSKNGIHQEKKKPAATNAPPAE